MPIEIKELHIKAIVTDRGNNKEFGDHDWKKGQEKMKEEIVKDCIDKIIQLLEDKKER